MTILITVLTNSFMAVAQNANDEHQFVFAVNTISMVKSETLFSYVAPSNILAWLLSPLRYCTTTRQFVLMNRVLIKTTHFPILFSIYTYESVFLSRRVFEPTNLIEDKKALERRARLNRFTPRHGKLHKARSVATFQQDMALDEVFRRTPRAQALGSTYRSHQRKQASKVVNHWMQGLRPEERATSEVGEDVEPFERLETPPRSLPSLAGHSRKARRASPLANRFRSTSSNITKIRRENAPAEQMNHNGTSRDRRNRNIDTVLQQPDADGDDELATNDEGESILSGSDREEKAAVADYFNSSPLVDLRRRQPVSPGSQTSPFGPGGLPAEADSSDAIRRRPVSGHYRMPSAPNASIRFKVPQITRTRAIFNDSENDMHPAESSSQVSPKKAKTPKRYAAATPTRPSIPARNVLQSAPNLAKLTTTESTSRMRDRSFMALDLTSDLGDNKAVGGGMVGAVPASFAAQMAWAAGGARNSGRSRDYEQMEDQQRMSKLMLVRMNTLEAGFKEVLKEVKDLRGSAVASVAGTASGTASGTEAGALKASATKTARTTKGTADENLYSKAWSKKKVAEQLSMDSLEQQEESADHVPRGGSV